MTFKTTPFDVVDFLDTPEDIQNYLSEAFASDDPKLIAIALGDVSRARGMSKVAKETGLSRESLYKSLSETGNPELATVLKVMQSMGLSLEPKPRGELGTP
ncbi:MAG: putative addiction module antidote protein [Rhodobacteraceae bacterium]|nr:putative addiction module antidote protein [Paracoccaceae bacterium]